MATKVVIYTLVICVISRHGNANITRSAEPLHILTTDVPVQGSEPVTSYSNSTAGGKEDGYGGEIFLLLVGVAVVLAFALQFSAAIQSAIIRSHRQMKVQSSHAYGDTTDAAVENDGSDKYHSQMVTLQGFIEYSDPISTQPPEHTEHPHPATPSATDQSGGSPTRHASTLRALRPSPRFLRPTAAPPPVPLHSSQSTLNSVQFTTDTDTHQSNRLSTASTPSESVTGQPMHTQYSTKTLPAGARINHRPPPPIPKKPKPERIRQVCNQMVNQRKAMSPSMVQSLVKRPPAPTSQAPRPPSAGSGAQPCTSPAKPLQSPTTMDSSPRSSSSSSTHPLLHQADEIGQHGKKLSPKSSPSNTTRPSRLPSNSRLPSVTTTHQSPVHTPLTKNAPSASVLSESTGHQSPSYSSPNNNSPSKLLSQFWDYSSPLHSPSSYSQGQILSAPTTPRLSAPTTPKHSGTPTHSTEYDDAAPLVVPASLGPRLSAERYTIEQEEDTVTGADGYMIMNSITTFQMTPSVQQNTAGGSPTPSSGAEDQGLLYDMPRFSAHHLGRDSDRHSVNSGHSSSSGHSVCGSITNSSTLGLDWPEPHYHNS